MTTWLWIFLIFTGGLFALKMTYVLCTALVLPITQGALYVSTSRPKIDAFLDAVPMKAGHVLIDIGCGDGRVLREARRRYRVKAKGYELNPMAYLKARLQNLTCKGVEVRRRNFWKANLSEANVIFCYLFPDVMQNLSDKLIVELNPGTVVASCNFALPGWQAVRVVRPGSAFHNDPIYIYRFDKTYMNSVQPSPEPYV